MDCLRPLLIYKLGVLLKMLRETQRLSTKSLSNILLHVLENPDSIDSIHINVFQHLLCQLLFQHSRVLYINPSLTLWTIQLVCRRLNRIKGFQHKTQFCVVHCECQKVMFCLFVGCFCVIPPLRFLKVVLNTSFAPCR